MRTDVHNSASVSLEHYCMLVNKNYTDLEALYFVEILDVGFDDHDKLWTSQARFTMIKWLWHDST